MATIQENFADNNGVVIHYIVLNYSPDKIPLIFIPGAITSADGILYGIKDHINFYCIIISIRGRGKSGKPIGPYTIESQVADIAAVVDKEEIENLYIIGHSVGGGLAAAYSVKYPEKIKGLIIADYAPVHPKFPDKWAERIRQSYPEIDNNFLSGMVRDSEKIDFTGILANYDFKKLFLKAGNEDSLLKPERAEEILGKLSNTKLITIENCGHEIFYEKPEEALKIIEEFMN
jgi:pimeloyl-ACP methyl ester carboxylesterase